MKKTVIRLLFGSGILIGAYFLHRYGLLEKTLDWIQTYGIWGPVVFVLVYILSCIFFIPSIIFTFSGGILFGVWQGFVLSLTGNGIGSLCAFLIGRYLVHDFVQKKTADNKEFQRLSSAFKRKGWKVILLARFSPISPFLIGNYAFGGTKIPAKHYLIASVLGTIPSALVYTYAGYVTGDLSLVGRTRSPEEWWLLGFGLIASFVLVWYLCRFAEKELGEISI